MGVRTESVGEVVSRNLQVNEGPRPEQRRVAARPTHILATCNYTSSGDTTEERTPRNEVRRKLIKAASERLKRLANGAKPPALSAFGGNRKWPKAELKESCCFQRVRLG